MRINFYSPRLTLLGALLSFSTLLAQAQPVINTLAPSANQANAARSGTITARFSQPLTAGSTAALRVFSGQRGGLRPGSSGSTTLSNDLLTFAPTYDFRPGETVRVSITTAAQSSGGALATPTVYQFMTAATGGNGIFSGGANVPVGAQPYRVVTADVDNDGDLDMLTPTFSGAAVDVKLNDGSGGFSSGAAAPVGSQPRGVTMGDLDGDGDLDFITANYNANSASVRFNNGSGVFSGGSDLPVGGRPQNAAVVDLDGDGDLDCLVANGSTNNVSTYFNDGSGNFSNRVDVPVGSFPFDLTTGDVDGDGDLDFMTGNVGVGTTTVSLRLNNGSGGFSNGNDPAVGTQPRSVALADVDTDGDLDLLTANFGSDNLSVRFNNGSGSFSGGANLPMAAGSSPCTIAAADIDGDGDLDLVATGFFSSDVTTRFNNGSGTFSGGTTIPVGQIPNGVATADLDGDLDLDLLVSNFTNGTVSIRFNALSMITDLTVSSPLNVSGTYNNVTITGPTTGGAGTATLNGALTVNGTLTVLAGGTLLTNCQPLTGPGSFTLAAGSTLGICDPLGIELSGASGAVQLAGTRSFSPDASYVYNGTAIQVTGGALPAAVRNLTTTNANDVTLTSPVAVAQVLTVAAAGDLLLNGQALTLLSNASGTALAVNGSSGVVQGNAAVQRYLSPSLNAGLGYRHLSTPVTGATVGGLTTPGFAPQLNTAYNNSATPGAVSPFPTVFGYNQARLASSTSNYSAFDKGWFSPASTGAALEVGRGYTVNIAGGEKPTFTGSLNTGNLTLPLARNAGATAIDAGWALVGNPYPAPIDWSMVNAADRPNLDASMYVFESSSQYGGTYRAYTNGMGAGNPLIGAGQGFFVRVSTGQTSGSLAFRNAQRLTTYAPQVPVRRGSADHRPVVQLRLQGPTGPADALVIYAEAGATPGPDTWFDAVKMANSSGLNLAARTADGSELAISGLPAFDLTTTVLLTVAVPTAGTYTFQAEQLLNLPATLDAILVDSHTGQQINLRQQPRYSCRLAASGSPARRFMLRFGPAASGLHSASIQVAANVVLYPNPAHQSVTVMMPGVAGATKVDAALLNTLGATVLRQAQALPPSGASFSLNVNALAAGIYMLRLQAGNTTVVKRVTVE